MSVNRSILDNITGNHRATNVTALKVNVEAAEQTLRKMEQLADEIEQTYESGNGNIHRCWQYCVDGLAGQSQAAMQEAVGECRREYKQIYSGLRTSIEQTSRYLEALVEADRTLAQAIRNA